MSRLCYPCCTDSCSLLILYVLFIWKSEKSKDASLTPDTLGELSSQLCWWLVTQVFVVFHFPISRCSWCDLCRFRIYHPKKTGPTRKELNNAATLIQRHIRGWLVRRRFDKLHRKVQHMARQLCSVQCTAALCPLAVHNVQLCSMQGGAALFHAVQCSTVFYNVMQHCSIMCSTVPHSTFHAMQCSSVPYSSVQQKYSATLFPTVQCNKNTVQHCSIQFSAALFHTVQCNKNTMQHCSIQFSATLFHTVHCNTVPYNATLFHTIQCSTVPYSWVQQCSIQCNTVPCSSMQHCSMQFRATLFHTVQHYSIQSNATGFHTVQYCSIQFSTTLFHTVQCNTVPYS